MADNSSDQQTSGVSTDSANAEPTTHDSSNWKVLGEEAASDGIGVLGHATAGTGVTRGLEGVTDSSSRGAAAVRGEATADSGITRAIDGEVRGNPDGIGVLGLAVSDAYSFSPAGNFPIGVWGETDRSGSESNVANAFGVLGNTHASSGQSIGVGGTNFNSASGVGVRGVDLSGDGFGVLSKGDSKTEGNHEVTGHQAVGSLGASVYLSSTQEIPDGGRITVQFDGVVADDRNEWNVSGNYYYTCATDGDYHVSTSVRWKSNFPPNSGHDIYVRVNGKDVARRVQFVESDSYSGILSEHVCKTLRGLSKGDEIEVQVSQNSGSKKNLVTDRAATYLTVDKIG